MADIRPNASGSPPRVYDSSWVVGTLLEHGPAHYQFDADNSMSYFVRLRTAETEQGARRRTQEADQEARPLDGRAPERRRTPDDGGVRVLWGADLKRAIEKSRSGVRVGQVVAVRVIGQERVQFAANSPVPPEKQQTAYKKRFEVERPQFVKRRVQFARRANETYQGARREGVDSPEAFALYLIHDGARRLAQIQYPDPADQQRFLARVRNFFEVSPDREAVIARAVANLGAKRTTTPTQRTKQSPQSDPAAEVPRREPPVRE
jgi:hypothetical protein